MKVRPARAVIAAYSCVLAVVLQTASPAAGESFRIRQLYSNQDGSDQFIEIEEFAGNSGQNRLAGKTIKVTNRSAVSKTFVFPDNLPNADTANRRVTIASNGLAEALAFPECSVPCPEIVVIVDYVMPDLFLPTDGGTIEFEGDAAWTFPELPTDGVHSLMRTGQVAMAAAQTYAGKAAIDSYGTAAEVLEFFNPALGKYFVSASQPDLDAIESGRIPGWQRTYGDFLAYSLPAARYYFGAPGLALPVCRFYIPPGKGDSHFYSAAADECDAIAQQHPDYVMETRTAFYAWLPDRVTGKCPFECVVYGPCTRPVYRLWNNRIDSSHRFTPDRAARDSMVEDGWISEGYGPNGVAMCVQ